MAVSMRLHHFAHSSASYRVRIILGLKGIEIAYNSIDMPGGEQRGAEYARLNPQKMLPCLELDDGRVIAQSLAIIDYLDHLAPEPAILPADPVERAQFKAQILMIACETSPLQAKIVQRHLADPCGVAEPQVEKWVAHWIRRGLSVVDEFVASHPRRGGFISGDAPGLLEAVIVPQMRNCERFGVDVSDLKALGALNALCLEHPAIQAAHPERWLVPA